MPLQRNLRGNLLSEIYIYVKKPPPPLPPNQETVETTNYNREDKILLEIIIAETYLRYLSVIKLKIKVNMYLLYPAWLTL